MSNRQSAIGIRNEQIGSWKSEMERAEIGEARAARESIGSGRSLTSLAARAGFPSESRGRKPSLFKGGESPRGFQMQTASSENPAQAISFERRRGLTSLAKGGRKSRERFPGGFKPCRALGRSRTLPCAKTGSASRSRTRKPSFFRGGESGSSPLTDDVHEISFVSRETKSVSEVIRRQINREAIYARLSAAARRGVRGIFRKSPLSPAEMAGLIDNSCGRGGAPAPSVAASFHPSSLAHHRSPFAGRPC